MEDIKSKFVFIPFLDEIGNDIGRCESRNLQEIMFKALNTPKCVGFNTLGYLKFEISNLQPSRYFGEHDGIYILRDEYRDNAIGSHRENSEQKLLPLANTVCLKPHILDTIFKQDPKIANSIFMAINPESTRCIKAALRLGFNEIYTFGPSETFAVKCAAKYGSNKNITAFKDSSLASLEKIISSKIEGVTFLFNDHPGQILDLISEINHPDNVMIISNLVNFDKSIESALSMIHPNVVTYYSNLGCISYNAEKS
jgi:hypothetical protein